MESARSVIIGTAGHIDHGKTALVQALTGKNTDRLKEEQERGISIDIDFAPLCFDDGTIIGMVDVPGHERFVRNMVAGAVGVDGALLVIDVREGIMPQTREHIGILEVLGVASGIVVLTKCDLVDAEWLAMAPELIRDELKDTLFADSPMICTSAKTGQGIEELKDCLHHLVQEMVVKDITGPFRLPVDRTFSIPGFGTVVSGTVWQGKVHVGDSVECLPGRRMIRVRGIQIHGRSVEEAHAGTRAALNLAGLDKTEIYRGHVIVSPGTLAESRLLDVRVLVISDLASVLRHREVVHIHLGTAETTGRVLLLEADELADGSSGFAQLVLDKPIAATTGDRFVLRGGTPLITFGGGRVVDAKPNRIHRRNRLDVVALLEAKDQENPMQRLVAKAMTGQFVTESEICEQLQVSPKDIDTVFSNASLETEFVRVPSGWLTDMTVSRVLMEIETDILALHQLNRFGSHVLRSVVVSRLRKLLCHYGVRDIDWFIDEGQSRGMWTVDSSKLRSSKWNVELTSSEEHLLSLLLELLFKAGLLVPAEEEIYTSYGKQTGLAKMLLFYAKENRLVVSPMEGIYWHAQVFDEAVSQIIALAQVHKRFSVAMVRDTLSISRKYAVLLLEYLDKIGFTKRDGDERIILQGVTNS